MNTLDAQHLRSTAASQWPRIRRFYSDDQTALSLLADFIQHHDSPATQFKAAMITAALHG